MAPKVPKASHDRALERPWSVPVTIHEVPATGRRFELHADEPTRAAIAAAAGLRGLSRLEATFDLTHHGRDGLRVAGHVSATVGQVCVVTLDPLENEVDEAVELIFDPDAVPEDIEASARAKPRTPAGGKTTVTLNALSDDTSEPLIDDTVDLGAIATEFLVLGLDPYPRKPGATFDPPSSDSETEHPFADLARLRGRQGGNER